METTSGDTRGPRPAGLEHRGAVFAGLGLGYKIELYDAGGRLLREPAR
jgi:hypothetical protein